MSHRVALRAGVALVALTAALACSDDAETPLEPAEADIVSLSFVGSDGCSHCHSQIYATFRNTGHPYKMNRVVNGQPPTYPFSAVPTPPAGYSWNDISWVIGGFGWKARFVDQKGYIITAGGKNQYNIATAGWSDYEKDVVKPYDCGACHTTGWSTQGHQDGMPGMMGTFKYGGVHCEECHGKGSLHVVAPRSVPMSIDTRAEACGRCHNRGGMNAQVIAKGGFIQHHEQYNELMAGSHESVTCVTCHDPHTTVKHAQHAGVPSIRRSCESCHRKAQASLAMAPFAAQHSGVKCVDCHMPMVTKNAVSSGKFVADIRTHIFTINPSAQASQFSTDGLLSSRYVTVEFACLGCHTGSQNTKAWAASMAPLVHGD